MPTDAVTAGEEVVSKVRYMPFAPVTGAAASGVAAAPEAFAPALPDVFAPAEPPVLAPATGWITGEGEEGTVKCCSFSGAPWRAVGAGSVRPPFSAFAPGLTVLPTQVPFALN